MLCELINKTFTTGSFPNSEKVARVVPIFKGGDSSDINNYRPISILPPLGKIFERAISIQLYGYFLEKKIITPEQYGFVKNKTTSNALVNFSRYVYDQLDQGNFVFSLFLDFRKAFDSVDHEILLGKLLHYGIRGPAHRLLGSYLSDRRQYVAINGTVSSSKWISHGVPQGSILGPLLFLIFINDIVHSSPIFRFILYADDSTLLYTFPRREVEIVHYRINLGLSDLNCWLKANKILINPTKSHYMILSYRNDVSTSPIMIGSSCITPVDKIKFLGLYIDSHLRFSHHIDYISSKISKLIGILYKINNFLPIYVLKSIYLSLIHPYLTYGLEVYYSTAEIHRNKLFIIQKKAIRAINSLPYNEHTEQYFLSNKILKLADLHHYHIAIYIYRSLYYDFDPDLSRYFHESSVLNVHHYNTRSANSIRVPLLKRSVSQNTIFFVGPKIWNKLPASVVNCRGIARFKSELRNHFLAFYSSD